MLLWMLLSCDGPEPTPSDSQLSAVCTDGTRWTEGQPAFRDASADWGLDELQPIGVRLSAVDFDGDGWPDLSVRGGPAAGGEERAGSWLLRNTGEGRFEDVTESSGILASREAGLLREGVVWVWADVDNDGDLDVYSGLADASGVLAPHTSEVLLNDGSGHFSLAEASSDLRVGAGDMPYGAAFADVDLDGHVDLWVTQYADSDYRQDQLYAGDGQGGFTEVTKDRGLKTRRWSSLSDVNGALSHSLAWSALACDLNNDGAPELLAASYGRAPNHLWLNDGAGSFENRSVASGYAYDHRVDWTDNESARCWCKLHPDDEDCEGVPAPEAISCTSDDDAFRWSHDSDREAYRLGGNSGATMCRDVDNDGWADLLTSEIVHWDVGSSSDPSELMFNTQDPQVVFERPGNEVTGLIRDHEVSAWNDGDITGSLLDFDNDGWADVYIGDSDYPGSRGRLFHQSAPRSFEPVPVDQGVDHYRSHGAVAADFDRDGDLDFVVGHSTARCDDECYSPAVPRLLENVLGQDGNWVQVRLVGGQGSNAAAIGARAELSTTETTQTQQVGGGHGQWGSQDDLTLHFGLGSACGGELTVTWPDAAGSTETHSLLAGHAFELVQGEGLRVLR
jgi:hypothetical protein